MACSNLSSTFHMGLQESMLGAWLSIAAMLQWLHELRRYACDADFPRSFLGCPDAVVPYLFVVLSVKLVTPKRNTLRPSVRLFDRVDTVRRDREGERSSTQLGANRVIRVQVHVL